VGPFSLEIVLVPFSYSDPVLPLLLLLPLLPLIDRIHYFGSHNLQGPSMSLPFAFHFWTLEVPFPFSLAFNIFFQVFLKLFNFKG